VTERYRSGAAPVDLENQFTHMHRLAGHNRGVVRVDEGGHLVLVVAKPIHEVNLIAKVGL